MNENEVKYCSNCKREIPGGNFMMHIVHCQRKLALCSKCDEPVPHSEYAVHNANFHSLVECTDCGLQMEKRHLLVHKNSSCSRREICCNYCHIEIEAADLAEHENYCGSRTERCEDCGEFVMLKYQQLHLDSNHGFLKLEDEPGPTPSWSNTRISSMNVLNDLGRQRKVSNASQDTGRPTAASNRLSPSKRTNDMPQLNSATTLSAPKAVHKPTIPLAGQDEVDIDRLLALRLAEQERERSSSLLQPRSIHHDKDETELVALPCEFCQAMIPANQLVLHETGCEPQLARYVPSAAPTPKNKKLPEPQDEGLPCEFCGALFPPHALLQHQDVCESSFLPTDSVLVNQLGLSRVSNIGTKKFLNQSNEHRLFPPRRQASPTSGGENDDRNPYLMEVRAALRKPVNSIPSGYSHISDGPSGDFLSTDVLPNSLTNGCGYRNGSTGAVPKQKAGKRSGIREVDQEIPGSTSSSVMHPPRSNAGRR